MSQPAPTPTSSTTSATTTAAPTLLVVASTLGGGLGAVVRDQANWFAARGWRVVAAVPSDVNRGQFEGIDTHPIPIPRSARDVRSMARTVRDVRSIIRKTRPDIIHCHSLRSFLVTRPATTKRPYVTLHGTGSIHGDPPGYHLLREAGLRIVPTLARRAFNAGVEERHGWSFLAHASPRLQTLSRRPMPEEGELTIIWLANLVEPKRPELFIRAIAQASATVPVRGVIAGGGGKRADMERLVAEIGAPVEFAGWVDDVGGLIERGVAVALFSRFEALAFVVQEAMWTGRPVIVSPLPSLRWLVGDAGLYAGDVDAAAEAIVELADPARAADLAVLAGERIRSLLSPHDPWPHLSSVFRRDLGLTG